MTGVFEPDPLGEMPCPDCGRIIFCAWDAEMNVVPLDQDDNGGVVVEEDANHIPWSRPAQDGQLALGQRLYRLHRPACPALAAVVDLGQLRQRRRPAGRRLPPDPERRHVHARAR